MKKFTDTKFKTENHLVMTRIQLNYFERIIM